jgi:hypothetical protein
LEYSPAFADWAAAESGMAFIKIRTFIGIRDNGEPTVALQRSGETREEIAWDGIHHQTISMLHI